MGIKPRWQRPEGPLNVWKVIDGHEILENGKKRPVKFSIQDVPDEEERRKEALLLLRTHYLTDEPLAKCLKIKDTDPDGVEDFTNLWKYSLDQGCVLACYKLDAKGNITDLVGCNALFMITKETGEDMKMLKSNFKSPNFRNVWKLFEDLSSESDVCKIYNVDKYIGSISLVLLPAYRGQKLGFHILNSRSCLGKKYGFPATSTLFSAPTSQMQAKRAGFEEGSSIDYKDAVDSRGNPMFPNIESKCATIMMKRFL